MTSFKVRSGTRDGEREYEFSCEYDGSYPAWETVAERARDTLDEHHPPVEDRNEWLVGRILKADDGLEIGRIDNTPLPVLRATTFARGA